MSKKEEQINTLWITACVSSTEDAVDACAEIEDSDHYHVIRASHARTNTVTLHVSGKSSKQNVKFERDGDVDDQWECRRDIPPKFKNSTGRNTRTDPQFESAELIHDGSGESDDIRTTVKNKNKKAGSWNNFDCDLVIKFS